MDCINRPVQPYLDSDMTSRWFDFGGDTLVRADQFIRLTSDRASQSGWLFSRTPLSATNWEVEVEFSIHGTGNLHGDGFAMWITKDRAKPGPVFGHTDEFEGLGIFFDTYKNNRPGTVFPYVMAMMGDGKTKYDSSNDGKNNEIGGCSVSHLFRVSQADLVGSWSSTSGSTHQGQIDLHPRPIPLFRAPVQGGRCMVVMLSY